MFPRFFSFLLTAVFLFSFSSQAIHAQAGATDSGPLSEPKIIYIAPGSSLKTIAKTLESEGVIANATVFNWYTRLSGRGTLLKAGEYEFPARASLDDVTKILTQGVSLDRKLTFPEGVTTAEILDQINAAEGLSGEISVEPLEGSLFPNTYYYSRNDTRDSFVKRMQDAMAKESQRLWEKRDKDLPIKSLEEAIILASIVEKETARVEEYAVVASVYLNRLRINKKLEADPTVIYALTMGQKKLDRPLLLKDLRVKSPWNTYRNKGLPPTPICNPGLGALEGVLRPVATPYIFFVADGTGGHVFAETFAEHERNVAKWRKINSGN
ncbi:MAG: endolytic transglycosylase MltG [Alphaproteobacteria bacterium]